MTQIRPIIEADILDVLPMIQALATHHGDKAAITVDELRRDALGPSPWVRVLVAEGLGYAALCPLSQLQFGVRGMDLHHIFVVESARGRGVGRALIDAAIACAKAEGARYLTVGTHPENVHAQDIYRSAGFEEFNAAGVRFRMKF
ncbi:GNAT family N-acetyltransferase [Sulfitobacter sp.]|jgi:GNAT superfamily N-acetyltransferase|uniref:GNAT family N-acetyltransferase n=1 Tax=Sulfitobacter sp. TaxID=1903071 RepID=UPI003002EE46